MKRILIASMLAASATLVAVPQVLAQQVGKMTAFQTVVSRTNGPKLGVGADIFLNDRLKSNATGLGMIVFDDESSAKIGPNASLVIDEFVYNPSTKRGRSTIRANSGLIRLYGGQISKRGRMNVRTPHMVLGVRGGIVEVSVKKELSEGILRAGQMTCKMGGRKRIVTKPGFSCISNGSELQVGPGGRNKFAILDSTDRIAGTGVPGRQGSGIEADIACGSKAARRLKRCGSRDGSLPRGDPYRKPNFTNDPLGRQ